MANAIYPVTKKAMLDYLLGLGTLKAALVDTGTTAYSSSHDFYNDISSAVVGTPQSISSPTTTGGLLDGGDVTFTSVSGASVEAIVVYVDTGTASTSPVLAYIDTSVTGLPVTPNGGDISVTWNASGILQL